MRFTCVVVLGCLAAPAALADIHRYRHQRAGLRVDHTVGDSRWEAARLRVRAAEFAPEMKSVFMDYAPLLNSMLEMTAERLSGWSTFEAIRTELGRVRLDFSLKAERK